MMRLSNIFQLELAVTVRGKQSLTMKLGLIFVVALPLIFIAMPSRVRIAGLLMLLVFTSFFGAAVNCLRRRVDGRVARLKLLPMPVWQIWGDTLLADAFFVLIRMGLVIALFIVVHGEEVSSGAVLSAAGLLLLTILLLNALGMLLGFVMKNNQEAHLVGALIAGGIAFFSGVLPAPPAVRDWMQGYTFWNPIARLGSSLEAMGGRVDLGTEGSGIGLTLFLAVALGAFLCRALDLRLPFRTKKDRNHENPSAIIV